DEGRERSGEDKAMRIVVFGTGGAGGYFGARLAQAGEDVVFIARGEHLNAIRSNGLRVETPDGLIVIHPAQATDAPQQVTDADVVLVGVKAWQVRDAAESIKPMMRPSTFVVPLQNGVEAAAQMTEVLTPSNVLGGLCGTLSWVIGPGQIRCISTGPGNFIKFGELDRQPSKRCEALSQAFERAGVNVE